MKEIPSSPAIKGKALLCGTRIDVHAVDCVSYIAPTALYIEQMTVIMMLPLKDVKGVKSVTVNACLVRSLWRKNRDG